MSAEHPNPYHSPLETDSRSKRKDSASVATILAPPILAIICTLIFWLGFASILNATVNAQNVMFIWSSTLIISRTMSTYLINRLWPQKLSAVSMCLGYVLFGIIFCILEGDTSNGTDLVQASILYGTLSIGPVIALVLTRFLNGNSASYNDLSNVEPTHNVDNPDRH